MKQIIRVGTRHSPLALWQADYAIDLIRQAFPQVEIQVVPIKTKGDKLLDVPLAKIGDKGLFIKELEQALLDKRIDLAVHSMKDLPTEIAAGLAIGAMTRRHDPRDVLISRDQVPFYRLKPGARIGTSSLRRRAQLLHARPDLDIEDLRGNLHTRLLKMEDRELDAIVLAAAGVERLGWQDKITEKLDIDLCLPAVGQGSIGLEVRQNDEFIHKLIQAAGDKETENCVLAERALLRALEGGCQVPLGALAVIDKEILVLEAMVASLDGVAMIRDRLVGDPANAEELGLLLAQKLKTRGAEAILNKIRCGDDT